MGIPLDELEALKLEDAQKEMETTTEVVAETEDTTETPAE